MKKLLVMISVLAALALGAAPAQALVGMPDDVPGCDVLQPFFLASIPGMGNTNTLMVFTDVGGYGIDFHYDVMTKKSETVYNDELPGTPFDVVSTDAISIIEKMAPTEKVKLEIDLDGDGVNDHYAGYMLFYAISSYSNHVIAQTLLVDLGAGMASAANVPAKEIAPVPVFPQIMSDSIFETELFSANALATAENLQIGGGQMAASWFALYPRYYILDADGKTYLFIWKSVNGLGTAGSDMHIAFFNDKEDAVSSNLPLPDELNIIDVEKYLPATLHSGVYPKEGFILIGLPDIYDRPASAEFGDWEWLGYTWLKAVGSAAESWTTLTPMHREVWWPGK
ncbi:MAG: hypothetical protein U5R49_15270 [Deltaproteobacteria bacterium]|nr:hypothetical protein [Deltaproteobacteria bacterium]